MDSIRTPERIKAYTALDSEREYQDAGVEDDLKTHMHALTPGEVLLTMEHCLTQARNAWYYSGFPNVQATEYVRKIGALAVQYMEQYGAPQREGFER